jgi:hypothetical protein
MAIVVEDGTGKTNADSYLSVAAFKTYCANYGYDISAITDPAIEILLRKATDYMVTVFRGSWQGDRTIYNQALDWPRAGVYRDDYEVILVNVMPPEVLAACAELAFVANTTSLLPTAAARTKKRVKIGPIEVEYDGDGGSVSAFIQAIRRLNPLLNAGASGNSVALVRC